MDQLIDTNHALLAEAAATRQRSRQIVTRAAAQRIKRDAMRSRWRRPFAVFPAEEPFTNNFRGLLATWLIAVRDGLASAGLLPENWKSS